MKPTLDLNGAKVTPETVACRDLSENQKREMLNLLQRHFDGVTPGQFEHDLEEKQQVILLYHGTELGGFSTLKSYAAEVDGRSLFVVISGDTIVTPSAWGTSALFQAWIAAVQAMCDRQAGRTCYWLLLTSGFRTYRLLPLFWKEFYPCHWRPTPPRQSRLMRALAAGQFGSQFDPNTGIVKFAQPQRLRPGLGEVAEGRRRNPHVDFFLSQNPGHGDGDELVCLTELSGSNLTRAGQRMLRRA